ncbi:hypothetical protein F5Y06DRAFT_304409 [Hypoxylon sp. FL0890]|nr:hypothetical protein F5Y06DRAFT_304409 [Hypoxylon sp. FL0890]
MSQLESIAPELRDMIIDECEPQALLCLISASPTYLAHFNARRARIIQRYTLAAQSDFPLRIVKEAVILLFLRKRRHDWLRLDPMQVNSILLKYLEDAVSPLGRAAYLRGPYWDKLPFLARMYDLAADVKSLTWQISPRARDVFWRLGGAHLVYRYTSCPGCQRIKRGVLMYELWSASIIYGRGRGRERGWGSEEVMKFWQYWLDAPREDECVVRYGFDSTRREEFNAVLHIRRRDLGLDLTKEIVELSRLGMERLLL